MHSSNRFYPTLIFDEKYAGLNELIFLISETLNYVIFDIFVTIKFLHFITISPISVIRTM